MGNRAAAAAQGLGTVGRREVGRVRPGRAAKAKAAGLHLSAHPQASCPTRGTSCTLSVRPGAAPARGARSRTRRGHKRASRAVGLNSLAGAAACRPRAAHPPHPARRPALTRSPLRGAPSRSHLVLRETAHVDEVAAQPVDDAVHRREAGVLGLWVAARERVSCAKYAAGARRLRCARTLRKSAAFTPRVVRCSSGRGSPQSMASSSPCGSSAGGASSAVGMVAGGEGGPPRLVLRPGLR